MSGSREQLRLVPTILMCARCRAVNSKHHMYTRTSSNALPLIQQLGNGVEFEYKSAFATGASAASATAGQRAVLLKDLRQYATYCPSCVIYAGQMLMAGQVLQNHCGHRLKVWRTPRNVYRNHPDILGSTTKLRKRTKNLSSASYCYRLKREAISWSQRWAATSCGAH
jgi:hypothetical protein